MRCVASRRPRFSVTSWPGDFLATRLERAESATDGISAWASLLHTGDFMVEASRNRITTIPAGIDLAGKTHRPRPHLSPQDVEITWLSESLHIPEVAQIERKAFGPLAWNRDEIRSAIHVRDFIPLIATFSGCLAGWLIHSIEYGRIRVVRVAVTPELQGLGIGSLLLDRAAGKLRKESPELWVSVPEQNLAAQIWLRGYGMTCMDTIRHLNGDVNYLFIKSIPLPRNGSSGVAVG